ncbi:MAG: hypothetical protein OHK003_31290 [Anaerolineales bacterium]
MNQLFWETISNLMREILEGFMHSSLASEFYLAGGTALSLQIGHQVDWQTVKTFFVEQAKNIEQGWLQ